jgi:hypothetical protein
MSEQPTQQRSEPSRKVSAALEQHDPAERRSLPSTAAILSRGVSLNQVLQAVRQLKPHIWQRG